METVEMKIGATIFWSTSPCNLSKCDCCKETIYGMNYIPFASIFFGKNKMPAQKLKGVLCEDCYEELYPIHPIL